jgi:hypothetical protein
LEQCASRLVGGHIGRSRYAQIRMLRDEHLLAPCPYATAARLHLPRLRTTHSFSLRLAPSTDQARLARGEAEVVANTQNAPDAASAHARRGRDTSLASLTSPAHVRVDAPHGGGWLARSSRAQGPCDRRRRGHAPRGRARQVRARLLRSPRVVVRLSARRIDGSRRAGRARVGGAHTRWHPVPVCRLPLPLARVLERRVVYPPRPDEAAHALVHAIHQVIHGLRNSRGGAVDDSTYVSLAMSR